MLQRFLVRSYDPRNVRFGLAGLSAATGHVEPDRKHHRHDLFLLMWPIFGLIYELALGLIAGVLESVPYLGPLLAAVRALLLAVSKGSMNPLWVALAYILVQGLENNVILPLIIAGSMKLHPVAVIFSMLLCMAAFGVLGVLVAAPMVAIVDILHDELYRKRFLPMVTDADVERLARKALREKMPEADDYGRADQAS